MQHHRTQVDILSLISIKWLGSQKPLNEFLFIQHFINKTDFKFRISKSRYENLSAEETQSDLTQLDQHTVLIWAKL